MPNDWTKAVTDYISTMARLREPMDDAQLRLAFDALLTLQHEHYKLLASQLPTREGRAR